MQDLDLKSVQLFVSVCDIGNMKQVAFLSHLEPPALSKRMTQLEQTLGVRLLNRGRNGSSPTDAGEVFLQHARQMLQSAHRAKLDMDAFRGGLKGLVRVAASASAIAETLLDDLTHFMRQPEHADIRVEVEERFTRDITRQVREGIFALGVCWQQADDSDGLLSLPYREDELIVAAPQGHPLVQHNRVAFADTLAYDHIGMYTPAGVYAMLNKAAAQAATTLHFRATVSNFDAALRMVAANLGITIVPREVVRASATFNKVEIIKLIDPWAKRQFGIHYRSYGGLSASAKRVLGYLNHCSQTDQAAFNGAISYLP